MNINSVSNENTRSVSINHYSSQTELNTTTSEEEKKLDNQECIALTPNANNSPETLPVVYEINSSSSESEDDLDTYFENQECDLEEPNMNDQSFSDEDLSFAYDAQDSNLSSSEGVDEITTIRETIIEETLLNIRPKLTFMEKKELISLFIKKVKTPKFSCSPLYMSRNVPPDFHVPKEPVFREDELGASSRANPENHVRIDRISRAAKLIEKKHKNLY